jgi:hypothetical protein
MSIRKVVALLAGFALVVGLIGYGVSATFTDQVKAKENINVGTFQCKIIAATPSGAALSVDGKSLTYTAPTIMSSAAGSAPLSFTVENTGTITDVLTVSTSTLSDPFSIINAPFGTVTLTNGGTQLYSTGIAWGPLNNSNLGASVTATWTVNCGEVTGQGTVIFDNTPPGAITGNFPSEAFEATQTSEWGSEVTFAGTARKLTTATVTMSSWACQSGGWNTDDCLTTPGATYSVPITFNIYQVGNGTTAGTLIVTKTQTFNIPYRPSYDATNCSGTGKWYDGTQCDNGKAVDITFAFPAGTTLPATAIFGVAYNTADYGVSPTHDENGPYNSLNVATYPGTGTATQASVGSFADDTIVYWNTATAANYTDGGASGVGIFRSDTGWGGYEPAVQIVATN